MLPVDFGIANRLPSLFAMEPATRLKPRDQVADVCLTIICGLGLMLASVAMTGGPLLFVAVVIMGATLLAVLQANQTVVHRSWSPFRWPKVRNWSPSRPYYHPYVYAPTPHRVDPDSGWLRGHRRGRELPVQG